MARIRDYKKIQSQDDVLNRVQDQIEVSFQELGRTEILDGVLLRNVSLTTGANDIEHKLDRTVRGWFLTRKRANADVWDTQDNNARPTKFLTLQASADVVVDIWAF